MAAFIGSFGGLLMIILVAVLLFKFITDLLPVKDSTAAGIRKIFFFAIFAAFTGFIYLFIGGYMYNFINEGETGVSYFDIQTIWNMKPISSFFFPEQIIDLLSGNDAQMAFVDNGKYTSEWLLEVMDEAGTGIFSVVSLLSSGRFLLYPLLVSLFSGVLYNMYIECAFYISFLSGIITITCMGMWLDKKFGYEQSKLYIMLISCVPGIFFLFLPSSFALFMALFAAFLVCFEYRCKWAMLIFALLCAVTHLSGIVAVIVFITVYVYGWGKKYSDIVYAAVILASQALLCIIYYAMGNVSDIEYWFLFIIPVIMASGYVDRPAISDKTAYKAVSVGLILLSGFYLTAKMYKLI